MIGRLLAFGVALAGLAATAPSVRAGPVESMPPSYQPQRVEVPTDAPYIMPDRSIRIIASAHAQRILTGFNALFMKAHPGFKFTLQGGHIHPGSVHTLLPRMAHGLTPFTSIGRDTYLAEIAPYLAIVGQEPLEIRVAHSAVRTADSALVAPSLAIYVNKANPIEKLTVEQVARIFATGHPKGDITRWGQLGLGGEEWAPRAIHPFGTPEYTAYGTYIQRYQLVGLPFCPAYEVPGRDAERHEILKRVDEDQAAIAFAALGIVTPNTKVVALAEKEGGYYSTGSAEDVAAGKYPYSRYIWFAVRRAPGQSLDPWIKEYLRLVLSKEGQEVIAALADDHLPLSAREAAEERVKLEAQP